jgi:hypothetical protein
MTRTLVYLTWLNSHGGFEYFLFTAKNAYQVDVNETGVTKNNILPQWPKSYGENANTIERTTYRKTRNVLVLRSQNLSIEQLEALSYIRSSALVQITYSRNSMRTVIVDSSSFVKYDEQVKGLYSIQFNLSYTDEIPSQTI